MKKLRTIYLCGVNEMAKKSNLEQPTGKPFPPLEGIKRNDLRKLTSNVTDELEY